MRALKLIVMASLLVWRPPPSEAGGYSDLVKGDDEARSQAALDILRAPYSHAESVVRRAAHVTTELPDPKHLPPLTALVRDSSLTSVTRASAALALGLIGRDHPDLWPPGNGDPAVHRPLPVFARRVLLDGLAHGNPVQLRRACAEALGTARIPEAEDLLAALVDERSEDPILRLAAGRSLTRLRGRPSGPAKGTLTSP